MEKTEVVTRSEEIRALKAEIKALKSGALSNICGELRRDASLARRRLREVDFYARSGFDAIIKMAKEEPRYDVLNTIVAKARDMKAALREVRDKK